MSLKFSSPHGFQLPKPSPPTKWELFAQKKGLFIINRTASWGYLSYAWKVLFFFLCYDSRKFFPGLACHFDLVITSVRISCRYWKMQERQTCLWWANQYLEATSWLWPCKWRQGHTNNWGQDDRWWILYNLCAVFSHSNNVCWIQWPNLISDN